MDSDWLTWALALCYTSIYALGVFMTTLCGVFMWMKTFLKTISLALGEGGRILPPSLISLLLLFCLICWSLSERVPRTKRIFSTRSLSGGTCLSRGNVCFPDTQWTAGRSGALCLATLSLEDIEDLYVYWTVVIGVFLIGLGITLVFREIKKVGCAVRCPARLPDRIDAVGRAVGSQTVTTSRHMESILEKLAALQRNIEVLETSLTKQG